jgi:hypothetical protein
MGFRSNESSVQARIDNAQIKPRKLIPRPNTAPPATFPEGQQPPSQPLGLVPMTIFAINAAQDGNEDHADAYLLIWDGGRCGLIDAGGTTKKNVFPTGDPSTMPSQVDQIGKVGDFLRGWGVNLSNFEFFIQTNFHYDRAMESPAIINEFKPKQYYAKIIENYAEPDTYTGSPATGDYQNTPIYQQQVLDTLANWSMHVTPPEENKVYVFGNLQLRFYNVGATGDANAQSLVVRIDYGSNRFLFLSDARPAQTEAIANRIGKVHFLFASDAGANVGMSENLIKTLKPIAAYINRKTDAEGIAAMSTANLLSWYGAKVYYPDYDNESATWLVTVGKLTTKLHGNQYESAKDRWFQTPDGANWMYIDSRGYPVMSDWMQIGDPNSLFWYAFDSNGHARRGWFKDGAYWYYLANGHETTNTRSYPDCAMYYSDWKYDNGNWFYLKSSGVMAANESIRLGNKTYNFDSHGVCTNP